MKHATIWAAVIMLGAATDAGAQAWIRQSPGKPLPKIHAYSDDGDGWNRVGDDGLKFYVDARGKCDEDWRTNLDSSLAVSANGQDFAHAYLGINEDHRNYGPDHGNDWEHLDFTGLYHPQQSPPIWPAQLCGETASSRAGNGPDRFQRLTKLRAEGFDIALPHAYTARFKLWCVSKKRVLPPPPKLWSADADVAATLRCHGNPKAYDVAPPPPPPGIQAMRLWVNPSGDATWSGFCPKTLHFSGEVTYQLPPGEHAANLKYRYVATRGAQVVRSDEFTTTFTASEKKILHIFNLEFPFSTGHPTIKAPTASDAPDVYKGSVALEFAGNPPIHANLVPAPFDVTCLKKGTVVAPLGGSGNLASPMAPIDPVVPNGSNTTPIPHGTAQVALPNFTVRGASPIRGAGNTIGYRVRVMNTGHIATPPSHLRFFRGSMAVPGADAAVGPIAPGAARDVLVNPSAALAAPGPLVVRVDANQQVRESDETDNDYAIRRLSLTQ